jgi:hypothetical protein
MKILNIEYFTSRNIINISCLLCLYLFCSTYASASNVNDPLLSIPKTNEIKVTLHPNERIDINKQDYLAINIPFPPNFLLLKDNLKITTSDGTEVKYYPEVTSKWHLEKYNNSIRSIKLWFKNSEQLSFPATLKITLSDKPSDIFDKKPTANKEWISYKKRVNTIIKDKEIKRTITLNEPVLWSVLDAEWLGICLLRTRSLPLASNNDLNWFDQLFLNYSETVSLALNDIEGEHEFKIQTNSAWLFDLASTLFNAYIKTGELKWLKNAHIATQIYSNFIDSSGAWVSFKPKRDIKTSYNQSMFIDLMLTGDESYHDKIEAVAKFVSTWRPKYSKEYTFWTERHLTYSFLGALVAWEATGNDKHLKRVKYVAHAIQDEIIKNSSEEMNIGCLPHEIDDHEGWVKEHLRGKFVCSPWMSAGLMDVLMRYYIQFNETETIKTIYHLADFFSRHGTYIGDKAKTTGEILPHYLVFTSELDAAKPGGDPWADRQHNCDVAGLISKGLWAGKVLNLDTKQIKSTTNGLLKTCKKTIPTEYINSKIYGGKYWRLRPPRKYSWLFGTTSDMSYLYTFK